MSASFQLSTPSTSSSFVMPSSKSEFQILDQVSRLTLDEPKPPSSPRFNTPQVRKRKASFVVTPPRAHDSTDEGLQEHNISYAALPPVGRGLPPMLPDSPQMDAAAEQNPFERHRPMHSPFGGVSRLNVDFLSTFQASAENSANRKRRFQNLAPRRPLRTVHFNAAFPTLEDEDYAITRPSAGPALITSGALKMRRRSRDEYSMFDCNL